MPLILKAILLTPVCITLLLIIPGLAAIVVTVVLAGLILAAPMTVMKGLKQREDDRNKLLYRRDSV